MRDNSKHKWETQIYGPVYLEQYSRKKFYNTYLYFKCVIKWFYKSILTVQNILQYTVPVYLFI